jgi:hypothetical protein
MCDGLRARGKRNQQQQNFIQEIALRVSRRLTGRLVPSVFGMFLLPTKRKTKKPQQ